MYIILDDGSDDVYKISSNVKLFCVLVVELKILLLFPFVSAFIEFTASIPNVLMSNDESPVDFVWFRYKIPSVILPLPKLPIDVFPTLSPDVQVIVALSDQLPGYCNEIPEFVNVLF